MVFISLVIYGSASLLCAVGRLIIFIQPLMQAFTRPKRINAIQNIKTAQPERQRHIAGSKINRFIENLQN